jgi:hypothetical protein
VRPRADMKPSFGLGLLGFAGMYVNAEIAADVQQIIANSTVDGILSTLCALAIFVVILDAARLWFGLVQDGLAAAIFCPRVRLCVHYPADVVAGVGLGPACGRLGAQCVAGTGSRLGGRAVREEVAELVKKSPTVQYRHGG